ncbi:hypothetical protein [Streptomyces sp. Inha503]|uniref:hypothetical protein n=1 Tax=Streptomyces sp. Inha503 TaxID=3383314 RepID=UPI00399FD0BE
MSKVRIWDGGEPRLFTRYEDARAPLADPRVSSDSTRDGYPVQSAIRRGSSNRTGSM